VGGWVAGALEQTRQTNMSTDDLGIINAVVTSDADDVIDRETRRSRQTTRVSKRRNMSPKIRPRAGDTVGPGKWNSLNHRPQTLDARVVRFLRIRLRVVAYRVYHHVADDVRQRGRATPARLWRRSGCVWWPGVVVRWRLSNWLVVKVTSWRRPRLDEVHRRRRRRIQLPVVGAQQAVVTRRRRRRVVSPVMTSIVNRKQFVDEVVESGSGADEVCVCADE